MEFILDDNLLYSRSEDFRLGLIHSLQELIQINIARIPLFKTARPRERIFNDIGGALAWTEMIASRVQDEHEIPSRTFTFDSQKLLGI